MLGKLTRCFSFKGALYTWGGNPASLGYSVASSTMSTATPALVSRFEPGTIQSCAIGNNHSAVVTTDGNVYTFGKGDYGILGHDSEEKITQPRLIESLSSMNIVMKQAAVGEYHTVLLTDDGDVWTMGYGGKLAGGFLRSLFSQGGGALGHDDLEDTFVPTPIETLQQRDATVQVSAGAYHSLALGENHEFLVWGKGEYGVMGNGNNKNNAQPLPNRFFYEILRDENVKVKQFQGCHYYSGALLEDGRMTVWGRNDDGQLGIGTSIGMDMYECEKWPVQLAHDLENKRVKAFELGEKISIFQTESDEVYVAGMKLWWTPHKLNRPDHGEITSIFAGDRFAGYVIDQRDVYFVGKMFKGKEVDEMIDLRLWKVKPHVFFDKKVEKIGGPGRNHYCFLLDN